MMMRTMESPAGSVDDVGHPQLSHVSNCLHLSKISRKFSSLYISHKPSNGIIWKFIFCPDNILWITVLPLARIMPGSTWWYDNEDDMYDDYDDDETTAWRWRYGSIKEGNDDSIIIIIMIIIWWWWNNSMMMMMIQQHDNEDTATSKRAMMISRDLITVESQCKPLSRAKNLANHHHHHHHHHYHNHHHHKHEHRHQTLSASKLSVLSSS